MINLSGRPIITAGQYDRSPLYPHTHTHTHTHTCKERELN